MKSKELNLYMYLHMACLVTAGVSTTLFSLNIHRSNRYKTSHVAKATLRLSISLHGKRYQDRVLSYACL